ncbi:MAG: UDP-glucose/GDP-mannose dehydrogenase family protein [Thermoplasmatales archaeon]|nr:UDP-glucose/GDP-mannose dehydrogenase family protein [Thermoplasmatales archaeon]
MTIKNPNEKGICIVGLGYVGAVTGACFAELGNHIIFVDIDEKKIKAVNSGRSPIFEPGIDELIKKNKGKIFGTQNFNEAFLQSNIIFICVGTPSKKEGSINLDQVVSVCNKIGVELRHKKGFPIIVVKSTVLPGTTQNLIKSIMEKKSEKKAFKDFGLASNPEFLREGNAVKDFLEADIILIGAEDQRTKKLLEDLYLPLASSKKIITDIKTAEMIKYANNAFLATKISFSNEIGNICKELGIDTYEVFKAVGLDHRINPAFFRAGIGFGGSCFPKDVQALIKKSEELGQDPKILKSVIAVNDEQPEKMIDLLKNHIQLKGKKIGILGLAFKPETDDIRESRATPVVDMLIKNGSNIIAYDPMAIDNFKKIFPQIDYAKSPDKILDSDAILILTEWKEFENLNYTGKIVIDGRRINKAKKEAEIYEGVCW